MDITPVNLIVMSAYADRVRHLAEDLPLYAAPLDRSATIHRAPPLSRTRVDSWVPYGRVIAREHPWLDRGERALHDLRAVCRRYQVRVTATNAPISLRVAVCAADLADAMCRIADEGPIELEGCSLALDPTSRCAVDAPAMEQIEGALSMPWLCGRLGVTLAARPWSSSRADLVLAPTGDRRLRYPRRWFNVGFAVADELRRRVLLPRAVGAAD
jgi:hypothetical protein